MGKIVFFVAGISKTLLHTVEYYRQDIQTLQSLGHEVIPCTKYREIPKSFDALFIWWWTYAAVPVVFARILRKPSIITGTYNFRYTEKIE